LLRERFLFLFDRTLSLLWLIRTVQATCSIYLEHSRIPVCTSRHESVVWGLLEGWWEWRGSHAQTQHPVLLDPAHAKLQSVDGRSQGWSAFPWDIRLSAHSSRWLLTLHL